MNPTILRLLKEAASGDANTQDLEELTRLLVLKGYYTPPPIKINKKERREILKKNKKLTPQERDLLLQDPEQAFQLARREKTPSEDTRIAASKDPLYAFRYAKEIDKITSDETRNGACQNFEYAMQYAKWEGVGVASKQMVCKSPEGSFRYAVEIQQGFCEETREGASQEAEFALRYALEVDKAPHPVTRTGACQDPEGAYLYALRVDAAPTEETRNAACRGHRQQEFGFLYARFIDNGYHPVTWRVAQGDRRYRELVGAPTTARP